MKFAAVGRNPQLAEGNPPPPTAEDIRPGSIRPLVVGGTHLAAGCILPLAEDTLPLVGGITGYTLPLAEGIQLVEGARRLA